MVCMEDERSIRSSIIIGLSERKLHLLYVITLANF